MNFHRTLFERKAFEQTLTHHLQDHHWVYLCAHAGAGKTVAVEHWLSKQKGKSILLSAVNVSEDETIHERYAYVAIDDLQDVTDTTQEKILLKMLTTNTNTRFILLSRAVLPSFLRPFHATGQMMVMDNVLTLEADAIENYLVQEIEMCTAELVNFVVQKTQGYALCVDCMAEWLQKGHECNDALVENVDNEIFEYYEQVVFDYFTPEEQAFMLKIARFDEFTIKMAEFVSGISRIGLMLNHVAKRSRFFLLVGKHRYQIFPLFQRFLIQHQEKVCSQNFVDNAWANAGLYYELEDDLIKAIYCYNQAKNAEKIKELLLRHTDRPPYQSYYVELRAYYFALTHEDVERSPELMSALSMIYSMIEQPEESEFWYGRLVEYGRHLKKDDMMRKKVTEKLAYLDLGLPHRGSKNVLNIFLHLPHLLGKEGSIHSLSATSGMPSLLHGAKDFCAWSKHDRQIYRLFRAKIESLMGENGVGIGDAALAECMFEKSCGENMTDIILHATAAMNATEHLGTLDIYFVAIVVLLRLSMMRENAYSAHQMLDTMENKLAQISNYRISENVRALRARLWMMEGKNDQVMQWMNREIQSPYQQFSHLKRYQYLVRARALLLCGREIEAITLITRLIPSFEKKQQLYHWMEAQLLLAIAQYRLKESGWKKTLDLAMIKIEKYRFYRLVAEEGMAILPLLREAKTHQKSKFCKEAVAQTKRYAQIYPLYLQKMQSNQPLLTSVQKQVLSLLGKGLSNEQIAQTMDVSLRTVKFHTGNIYAKLGVKGRAQAMAIAKMMTNDQMGS